MGKDSAIGWTHHTWNSWLGCAKVSPGCKFCYAEKWAARNPEQFGVWGKNGKRIVRAEAGWNEVLAWDRAAARAGERHRVFAFSMADICEDWGGFPVDNRGNHLTTCHLDGRLRYVPWTGSGQRITLDHIRERTFDLIQQTQNLDWLIVTKRPENLEAILPWTSEHNGEYRERFSPNVWVGVSVENREQAAKRIPILNRIPAAVRFVSAEPLLEYVDFDSYMRGVCMECGGSGETYGHYFSDNGLGTCESCRGKQEDGSNLGLDWIIVGGESGGEARRFDLNWCRRIVEDRNCPVYVKQMGSNPVTTFPHIDCRQGIKADPIDNGSLSAIRFEHKKGEDPSEWPEDLAACREFPAARKPGDE